MPYADFAMLEITWTYTPKDFFEAELRAPALRGDLVLTGGSAKLSATGREKEDRRNVIREATECLRRVMNARAILVGRSYELSEAQSVEIDSEGRKHYVLLVNSVRQEERVGNVDIVHTDSSGKVLRDTKRQRIAEEASYVQRLAAAAETLPTLQRMFASFVKSFDDPNNALVHLYEVREAAAEYFGAEKDARATLGVTKSAWSRLGELANHVPLAEGRHRGSSGASLRSATQAELQEAREVAKSIIDAFALRA